MRQCNTAGVCVCVRDLVGKGGTGGYYSFKSLSASYGQIIVFGLTYLILLLHVPALFMTSSIVYQSESNFYLC